MKNKTIKILLAISIVFNIGLVIYSFYMQTVAEKSRVEAEEQRLIAEKNMEMAQEAQKEAEKIMIIAQEQRMLAEQARKQAELSED